MTVFPSESSTFDLPVRIERWSAWSPALTTAEQWTALAERGELSNDLFAGEELPKIDFIPIGLRKKLSALTKVSLYVAHHCLDESERRSVPTVFASRHGENAVTVELLSSIAQSTPVSPMGFARSVHNTASGLFGIAEKNEAASTALAAGRVTFAMAFLEAALQLLEDRQCKKRLLVYADERAPKDFHDYLDEPPAVYGVAMLLTEAAAPVRYIIDTQFPSPVRFLLRHLTEGASPA